jgi:phage baseplate assembly protein W
MSKIEPVFADIDLNFTRNPITGDIYRKVDNDAIKISIKNLIKTMYYERPFNSKLGSSVNNLLFEQASPIVGMMLKKAIEQVITNYEPRVDLEQVVVTMSADENSLDVEIHYTILGTQALQTFNVILERTR